MISISIVCENGTHLRYYRLATGVNVGDRIVLASATFPEGLRQEVTDKYTVVAVTHLLQDFRHGDELNPYTYADPGHSLIVTVKPHE